MPCEIVLLHSVLGVRPAVTAFADRLRERGHTVHVLDLFDGQTFDTVDDGIAHQQAVGIPNLMDQLGRALEGLPADLVYAGYSMGAAFAQYFADRRPGARGAILLHGAEPQEEGVNAIPLTIHSMADDPWFDADIARSLPNAEVHLYPGSGHVFTDDGHEDYDVGAARLVEERVNAFLDRL